MILQVLFLFFVKSSAVTLEFRHVTEPLSWSDAFISGLCTTSHHVTGYVAPESVQGSISLTNIDVPEAWVGLYGISTNFLKFDGCFMFEENALNGENIPKVSLKEGEDSIGACYLFCNGSLFGLSMDMCYCLATLSPSSSGFCNVNSFTGIWFCKAPGGGVCGGGLIQQTGLRCLCMYRQRSIAAKVDIRVPGNCVSYDVIESESILNDCNTPKYFVCTENTTQQRVVFQNLEHSWWNAALMCQSSAHAFGNRSSVINYLESPNSTTVESYWTNKFRKQFFSFASPGKEAIYDQCVAAKRESGELKFFLRDCLDELPALCFSVNQEVTLPEQESTSAFVSLTDNDTSDGYTTSVYENSSTSGRVVVIYAVESSSIWPVVYVVLGILLIIFTVLAMCYRKRSITTAKKSTKSLKIKPPPKSEVTNNAITHPEKASQETIVSKDDTLQGAPVEPERYTSLTSAVIDVPEHEYMEIGQEIKVPAVTATDEIHEKVSDLQEKPETVEIGSGTVKNHGGDSMTGDDETYNELNEKESQPEVMYDRTSYLDVTYDEIGDPKKSKASDDVLYDVIDPLK